MPTRAIDERTEMTREALEKAVVEHLRFTCMTEAEQAQPRDWYTALAHAVRDRITQRWLATRAAHRESDCKRAYYLSAEFLLGRALAHNLINLHLFDEARAIFAERGMDLNVLLEEEHDPGLGNGGLGRLAACFLDSMATLGLPGFGYGIRYDYGIFEQHIEGGHQVEKGDDWLRDGNPWEHPRYEHTVPVNFYGRVVEATDAQGQFSVNWIDTQQVLGVPFDLPVTGYGTDTVNTLRLWSAKAAKAFNLDLFNAGDYRRAVEAKALSESISKVLYPSDHSPEGRELRLKQQYFFV
ncbi:MAG: glycogen/starch/alpha-glucan phosphorylase, partial [Myxococcales bacterium]|nr:glycogen/starch/alpha-glucan phosphorylase [Myxococcales bacterium]